MIVKVWNPKVIIGHSTAANALTRCNQKLQVILTDALDKAYPDLAKTVVVVSGNTKKVTVTGRDVDVQTEQAVTMAVSKTLISIEQKH